MKRGGLTLGGANERHMSEEGRKEERREECK
jgi:hypothetical protein